MRIGSFALAVPIVTLVATLSLAAASAQTDGSAAAAAAKAASGAQAPTTIDAKAAAAGTAAGADSVAPQGIQAPKATASKADKSKAGVPKVGGGKPGFAFKSVTVDLPLGDEQVFPEGRFMQVVNNDCRLCHSPDMILNQPALPKGGWRAEIIKMRDVYKAPVPDDDADVIAAYLETAIGLNRPHWR
jgi:hypothetical protein